MRNRVGIDLLPTIRSSQVQCSMIPDLFSVPSTFKGRIFGSKGASATLFCFVNFLSRNVPLAPESIRAFIVYRVSAFPPFPFTKNGTVKDRLFACANNTGEIGMEVGAGTDAGAGRFFKNPWIPWT